MDSYFFKPVKPPKKTMQDAFSPDDAPAGTLPQAVFFFSILPKFVQHFITAFVQVFHKLFGALGDIIWQSMRMDAKAQQTKPRYAGGARESYSTHASFDHVRRIENVEYELAGMRGGGVNKYFKPNVELRLRRLESQVGIRPVSPK